MDIKIPSMYFRYFVYSSLEEDRCKRIYGGSYSPGNVMVRGIPKPYTDILTDLDATEPSTIVVIKGDIRKIKYTEPKY